MEAPNAQARPGNWFEALKRCHLPHWRCSASDTCPLIGLLACNEEGDMLSRLTIRFHRMADVPWMEEAIRPEVWERPVSEWLGSFSDGTAKLNSQTPTLPLLTNHLDHHGGQLPLGWKPGSGPSVWSGGDKVSPVTHLVGFSYGQGKEPGSLPADAPNSNSQFVILKSFVRRQNLIGQSPSLHLNPPPTHFHVANNRRRQSGYAARAR
ncbi:hypothetical protein B0T20DRAFT_394757 [Sordaria brevicollis]|uniref:Uncharacterized protein n=1 Tax=Sordaria brevicollis TaxID=83679 RepID=A0AAE0PAF4_SORBR|nr:hypothetical protein B0T20DRAFT_394757 [Sordaria brevicollis]